MREPESCGIMALISSFKFSFFFHLLAGHCPVSSGQCEMFHLVTFISFICFSLFSSLSDFEFVVSKKKIKFSFSVNLPVPQKMKETGVGEKKENVGKG